jgi:alkanesulfonate monooxygenase SsuD/methylene tetrahydromethanopterin reductase-like flavin-dependent oxidoreductase (luciferase family)
MPETREIQGAQSQGRSHRRPRPKKEQLTIRQILQRLAGARGHNVFTGTPEQAADEMERWFRAGAADGFNLMPPYLPGGLVDFVDQVVP